MRALFVAFALVVGCVSTSDAFHLFRGDEAGGCSTAENFTQPACCPASGQVSDDPVLVEGTNIRDTGPIGATVYLLHNSFNEAQTLAPGVVVITPGQAVEWKWASVHCHSVTGSLPLTEPGGPLEGAGTPLFESGFLYPADPPAATDMMGLAAIAGPAGALDYPIPDLEKQTLSFVHTFKDAGVYPYHCIHHQEIGMEGLVIVLPPQ
jgi:plastocyanin